MKKTLATAAILSFSWSAYASLVDHGTYITDTSSGLDWLDTQILAGTSYSMVKNGYGGFIGSGWRFARTEDLIGLVETYVGALPELGAPTWTYLDYSDGAYDRAYAAIETLGINVAFGTPPDPRATQGRWYETLNGIAAQGWYDDGNGEEKIGVFDLAAYVWSDGQGIYAMTEIIPDFVSPDYFTGPNVSSILVRDNVSSVPLPGALPLMVSGFLALGGAYRRQKRSA
jgi:hypothetical protein